MAWRNIGKGEDRRYQQMRKKSPDSFWLVSLWKVFGLQAAIMWVVAVPAIYPGPLMVLPGTHRGPTWDHHAEGQFCGALDPNATGLDFSKAVPLTGPAGSMTILARKRRRSTGC